MYLARSGSPGRRHASAYSPGSARMWIGMAAEPNLAAASAAPRRAGPAVRPCRTRMSQPIEPHLDEILAFCAEDPVERVFLEDVARRRLGRFSAFADNGRLTALCHVGANVVPSGADCGRFAEAAARGRARMIIGEERAVDELWDDLAGLMPTPRNDRPGQPVYALTEPPPAGDTGLRPATDKDFPLLLPRSEEHTSELQ